MTDDDAIRKTAEGMIRNYGERAAYEAQAIASRHAVPSPEAKGFWLAVANVIKSVFKSR